MKLDSRRCKISLAVYARNVLLWERRAQICVIQTAVLDALPCCLPQNTSWRLVVVRTETAVTTVPAAGGSPIPVDSKQLVSLGGVLFSLVQNPFRIPYAKKIFFYIETPGYSIGCVGYTHSSWSFVLRRYFFMDLDRW
jgi:hypothetical protein